jgi:glycosyltransferase involved in cell wall biosynthesis
MAATVSACLIVQDEEERLPGALASVAFCDEIVVVDGGSRDRTVEVARAAGARVVENPWPGYARQRNVAIEHAHGDWVLEVDADERLTPELQAEVRAFLADPPPGFDMAALPLRDVFLGGRLGPSARYPVYRYRLFRRDAYRHDERRTVHEGLWANGAVWPLRGDLEHVLAGTWREAFADTWAYARLGARQVEAPAGPRPYLVGLVLRPPAKFLHRLLVLGGWRDGWRGAAKIGLDCGSDVIVWLRLAARRARGEGSHAAAYHVGHRRVYQGPVRLAAIAAGPRQTARAVAWLEQARTAGADPVLLTDTPPAIGRRLHVRALARLGPLALARGLDAEFQLRPIDALVPIGLRARAVTRLVPPNLQGAVPPVDADAGPEAVEKTVRSARP